MPECREDEREKEKEKEKLCQTETDGDESWEEHLDRKKRHEAEIADHESLQKEGITNGEESVLFQFLKMSDKILVECLHSNFFWIPGPSKGGQAGSG